MARADSGCEVWQQDLLQLQLPTESFDGIFANAVLFHVPSVELPGVLARLHEALKGGGVLFCSNPRGQDEEGWSGDRYGVWYSWPSWRGGCWPPALSNWSTTIVLPGCLGPSNPGSPVSGARLAADAGRRMQPASRFVLRFARSNSCCI